mgnify:CR=1 FL=1
MVPKSSHWAALTQNEAIYLHDSTEISFSASTSSTFNRMLSTMSVRACACAVVRVCARPRNIGALTRVRTTAGQPGHEDRIAITFSYSTFTVGTSEQVVTFDWLSLICTPKFLVASITRNSRHTWHSRHHTHDTTRTTPGTVGGAATFACYLHEIAMILYAKSRKWCCPLPPGKDVDDDGAEEEEEGDDAHNFADEAQKVQPCPRHSGT